MVTMSSPTDSICSSDGSTTVASGDGSGDGDTGGGSDVSKDGRRQEKRRKREENEFRRFPDNLCIDKRKLTVKKSKEELELFEPLDHKSVNVNKGSHRIVVFKNAPPRTYSKPFTRFSLPCDVDGQDYGKYGRNMVREFRVEIHGFTFFVDFVVIGYANEGEPSIIFGIDFLVTSKSRVDFGIGGMCIDLTMLEEMKDIDVMLDKSVKNLEKVGSSNGDLAKMGKASCNKNHKVNKLTPPPQIKIKVMPSTSTIAPPSPIYHPLTQKQKEKVKEALDHKYKELEESKPILEVLENYMIYQKKIDEVLIGRARLSNDDYGEEVKMRIVEDGLPKKMCDPGNFVLPAKVNGTIEMNALANTGESVSVLPYYLFMNLGLGDPKTYNSNITMADNTQAKAIGEVKNVRIEIGYQAYLVDFLILDIPVDKELPLLLGHPFFRTCGVVIDMGSGTLCINDGVIRHTYFPKPRAKAYLDNFTQEEEDIEDDMERALAMEAYFNPFKNIVVFKKLSDFLGSLPVQLKNTDWVNEGHGTYKKVEGDEAWHAKFEVTTSKSYARIVSKPAYCNFKKRNKQGNFKNKMKYEYLHDDGDVFIDYSWERDLSIYGDVYLEWCLEFFSMMYFDKGVDRTNLMTKKCIWFRLFRVEKVLTLPEFMVLLGFYEEIELNHGLFPIYFTKLEVNDKLFNHEAFWQKIQKPTSTNPRTSLIKELRMRTVHKLLVGSLVHKAGSKERCQKRGMWMMSALEESHGINLAWVIAKHLCKHVLADQSNFAYPTYEPPNVPPYPYLYVPYPYPYTHYPDTGSPSFKGDHYRAHGDGYHAGSIVPSLGYEIGGLLAGFHGEDFDPIVHSEDCVESDDDEMRD
uniref:Reverse transcriptase domain-containing protein n=1 Tax=Tanacetum cinerariifolium TaxID=118510 RepID=A0A6L2K1E4_TANCI|nr:hypothetical protein [Tanacetum cinerariifolium]